MSKPRSSAGQAAPPAQAAAPEPTFEEGKITVAVRCRPFNERERTMKGVQCIEFNGSGLTIYERGVPGPNASEVEKAGKHHAFAFDYTYPASVPQEQVFIDVGQPVLTASFRGYNTCIFAYGQTGSGKSYAMMGPSGGRDASKDPGIIPRLCTTLFATLKSKIDENSAAIEEKLATGAAPHEAPPKLDIIVEVSYLEIYQEKIKCLLSPSKDNLKVRQHPALGVYVESLTEVAVGSYDKVFELIDGGNNSRAIAATNMNATSSRSHMIVTLAFDQVLHCSPHCSPSFADHQARRWAVDHQDQRG